MNPTKDATPTISGTGEVGAQIKVTTPAGETLTAVVAPTGMWSVTPTLALTDGAQTISAVATDQTGNSSNAVTATVTIDTIAPGKPTLSATTQTSGLVTATGTAEVNSTVSVTFSDGSTATVKADSAGSYSVTSKVKQPNGTIKAVASDAVGNIDATNNSATFAYSLSVNIEPSAADATIVMDEDTVHTFSAAEFGFNDSKDASADQLLNIIITSVPAVGVFTLAGVAVKAGQVIPAAQLSTLTFKPVLDTNGVTYTSFGFKVQDNGGTQYGASDTSKVSNTITIDVTPVSDGPVNVIVNKSTPEDVPLPLSDLSVTGLPSENLINVKLEVSTGKLSATSSAAVTVTGSETGALSLSGKASDINAYLASSATQPKFTPVLNTNGTVNLTMTTVDSVSTLQDVDQVTINVSPVNDAPDSFYNNVKITKNSLPTFTAIEAGQTMDLANLSISDVDDNASISQPLTPAGNGLEGGLGGSAVYTILGADGVVLDDGVLKIKGLTGTVSGTKTTYTQGTATAVFDTVTASLTITGEKLTDMNAAIANLQYVDSAASVGDVKLKFAITDRAGLVDAESLNISLPINDNRFLTNDADGTLAKPIEAGAGQDIVFGKSGGDVITGGADVDVVFGGFGTGVRNYQFDYWNLPKTGTGTGTAIGGGSGFSYQIFTPLLNNEIGWNSPTRLEYISVTNQGRPSNFKNGFYSLDATALPGDKMALSQSILTAEGEAYVAKLTLAIGASSAAVTVAWNGVDVLTFTGASGAYTAPSGITISRSAALNTSGASTFYTYSIAGLVGASGANNTLLALKANGTDDTANIITELSVDPVNPDVGDTLAGGIGADYIWGQGGSDVLYGGELNSTKLNTDADADVFAFDMRMNEGADVVKDFVTGTDQIYLVNFLNNNTLGSKYPGQNGMDNAGTNIDATLSSETNLNAADFIGSQAIVLSDSGTGLKLAFGNGTSIVLEGIAYEATAVSGNKAYGSVEELLGVNETQILYITGDSIPNGMGVVI